MGDHPEILPLAVFLLIILFSSLKSKSKKSAPASAPKPQQEPQAPPIPQSPARGSEVSGAAAATKQSGLSPRAAIGQPKPKGTHKPSQPKPKAEDPYAVTHPDVPAAANEWRKAVIAHEILKRKF